MCSKRGADNYKNLSSGRIMEADYLEERETCVIQSTIQFERRIKGNNMQMRPYNLQIN